MRTRNIKKQLWVSEDEAKMLKMKSELVGLKESELLRNLILGFEPKEKPGEEFYQAIKEMRKFANNLNQIAKKANALNFIDYPLYKKEADKWNKFIVEIKKKFLLPKGINNGNNRDMEN